MNAAGPFIILAGLLLQIDRRPAFPKEPHSSITHRQLKTAFIYLAPSFPTSSDTTFLPAPF
jgi:hypothetical protein